MKRAMVLLAALALHAGVLRAADVATSSGTRALLFQFSGLSDLGLSGYSGGVGFRYYVRNDLALRPGISFSWAGRRIRPNPVPPGQPIPSDDRKIDTSVGLSVALEKHLKGPRSVSPYLGAEIGASYSDKKTEPSVTPVEPPGTLTKVTAKAFDGGIYGVLGFEWGFAESLTLGGESRLGFRLYTSKSEDEYNTLPDTIVDNTAGFSLGFDTVAIYLSVGI